uniref:Uncharacterized protein n=1 Tax=Arundo donax TaxID=35708 RepID=A0A0A9B4G2_ARUDO
MMYSTECWLLPPRHCLMKFLKVKGLLNAEFKFDSIAKISKKFLHRFVHPYEESVPGLVAAFASSCAGRHKWE